MEKDKTKIKKKGIIVEDIKKRMPSKKPLGSDKINKKMKKNLFLKLFSWLVSIILLGLFIALFLPEKNSSHKTLLDDLKIKTSFNLSKMQNFFTFSKKDYSPAKTQDTQKNIGRPLEETSSMEKSENANWWLNSGGIAYFQEAEFNTNKGPLPEESAWRKLYAKHNPRDTDNGYFPQNIFRLVNKGKWKNFSQSVYFKIEKINLSESEYRNESNGVLLFNRYQNGDNLYYTGVRVDGHVIIKKKISGRYYTLLEKSLFKSKENYHRQNNPNLIPEDSWLGIKSELKNIKDNTVEIKIFIDDGNGGWRLIAETQDKGDKYGGLPFLEKGYTGIRTDFMDVTFRDYQVIEK